MSEAKREATVEVVKARGTRADGSRYTGSLVRWVDASGYACSGVAIHESHACALNEAESVAIRLARSFGLCSVRDRTKVAPALSDRGGF